MFGRINEVPSEGALGSKVKVNGFSGERDEARAHAEWFVDLPQDVLHYPQHRWP